MLVLVQVVWVLAQVFLATLSSPFAHAIVVHHCNNGFPFAQALVVHLLGDEHRDIGQLVIAVRLLILPSHKSKLHRLASHA